MLEAMVFVCPTLEATLCLLARLAVQAATDMFAYPLSSKHKTSFPPIYIYIYIYIYIHKSRYVTHILRVKLASEANEGK